MHVEKIRELLKAAPFKPFTLRLVDGRKIHVKHPDFASLPPGHRTIYLFDDEAGVEMIDMPLILSLESG